MFAEELNANLTICKLDEDNVVLSAMASQHGLDH